MQENQLEDINNQAREWFTLMQSGSMSELEAQQLQSWLQGSDAHRHTYDQYENIWRDLDNLPQAEKNALKRSVKPSIFESMVNSLNNIVSGIGALKPYNGIALVSVCALLVSAIFFTLPSEKVSIQNFSTTTGEIKSFTLADGNEITLGAKSGLQAWATAKERHVVLTSGQAFFKVSKNPQKPFWVAAGPTKIRVVGTQFDVRKGPDRTRVAVLEGIVNVSGNTKNSTEVILTAEQQVTHLSSGKFEKVNIISAAEIESWRNGRLFYLRANLADVIADANRYFKQSITLGSKELADLKVTAAVSTIEVEGFTDMLTSSLPVVLHKDSQNNIVVLSRKDSTTK
ncbi:MAG: FecR domain-containing protein [Cellvibrio sp.]